MALASASSSHPKRLPKPRCVHKQAQRGGQTRPAGARRHRVCKRRKPPHRVTLPAPVVSPPILPPSPPPTAPAGKGPAGPTSPDLPSNPGNPTDPNDPNEPKIERADLIPNPTFEDAGQPLSCFVSFDNSDALVSSETAKPIAGARSLHLEIKKFARAGCIHDYGAEGPKAKSVTLEGDLRNDGAAAVELCAIEYYADSQEPHQTCKTFAASGGKVVHVSLAVAGEDRVISRAFFQLKSPGEATALATLDNAHLFVDSIAGSGGPHGGGGGGGGDGGGGAPNVDGRYAAMVSPTDGESFTGPLDLRLVGIGHDPNVFVNSPVDGKGMNAAKLEFFLDGQKIFEQSGSEAEYHVFKGFVHGLAAAPGPHTVFSRATFVDPAKTIDSPPVTINVVPTPTYTQTVNLTQDVVLSGSQSFELLGAPGQRIRLNGNGHSIRSTSATSGHLALKYVDVYGLGDPAHPGTPGIDVATAGSVAIEDSVFDTSNPVDLDLGGSATASLKRNLFRSNMRTPIGQQPGGDAISPTVPGIELTGSSAATKVFSGNNVGAAPVRFDHVNHWTIGGATDAASNVLIGPRASFEVLQSSNVTIEGNFVDHNYFGGWSQGQLLELHETSPITVEHNVLLDSSWPVRGIAGEFAYNLVLEAGHQWMVPGNNAYIHHNLFIGGDNDEGGITGFYENSVRIENNTFDGLLGPLARTAIDWHEGQTTLVSNAFLGFPTWTTGVVELDPAGHGTIAADYNGFFNPQTSDYTDGRHPAHDLAGGASTDPRFAGPLPTETFDMSRVGVWQRSLPISQILAAYRARFTPGSGSPYIDAGDPAGGAGNDIGAIGAGLANTLDRFGSFAGGGK